MIDYTKNRPQGRLSQLNKFNHLRGGKRGSNASAIFYREPYLSEKHAALILADRRERGTL